MLIEISFSCQSPRTEFASAVVAAVLEHLCQRLWLRLGFETESLISLLANVDKGAVDLLEAFAVNSPGPVISRSLFVSMILERFPQDDVSVVMVLVVANC